MRVRVFLAACVVVAGCASHSGHLNLGGTAGSKISHAADVVVPTTVLGLTVSQEDVAKTLEDTRRSYVDSLVMYGLRSDNLLEATLQVSRFDPGTKFTTDRFQQEVVDQVGSSPSPPVANVGGTKVFLTSGNRQDIAVWFRGPYLFILASRQDFAFPRALLRALLQVNVP